MSFGRNPLRSPEDNLEEGEDPYFTRQHEDDYEDDSGGDEPHDPSDDDGAVQRGDRVGIGGPSHPHRPETGRMGS
jgi:hypothetical protein